MMLKNFCNFVRSNNGIVIKKIPIFLEIQTKIGEKNDMISLDLLSNTSANKKRTDEANVARY